ncbi:hypothetical protein Gasu_41810 isoform 2 [Galdieria sulphuraria]|uniref:G-patch domain-containing protein n=1 Tax=Galdieria sulphuraria TaxID=130081 RepID=M2XXK7_GALSU|nr:hypothetical protein Gasu_41810 isoform 2 [Galdieria sulphuraria]EME28338.1 hypothetical protein isoform 2 [Galdieria sulphuraria]|eukprot:XP_005704858.1 hypothetical protein isoform 2 [Galdieria sulphuraria]
MTQDEKATTNKGLAILKKMGFRERIGRFESGILQPISPKKVLGRQGLGYDSSQESTLHYADTSSFHGIADWEVESSIEEIKPQTNSSISVFTKRKRLSKDVNQVEENNALDCLLLERRQETVRCGLLVDFDVLISNHETRRVQALKETVESFSETKYDWDSLQWLLQDEESDWTLLQKVMNFLFSNVLDEDEMSSTYERFESNIMKQPLERNIRAQQLCEGLSKKPLVRVGMLHKGSRLRMNEEMNVLSVRNLQICAYAVSLDTFAHVPYNEQWIELCRRLGRQFNMFSFIMLNCIGVCPQDCYAVLTPHKASTHRPSQLEVGVILSSIQPIRWNSISTSLDATGVLHEIMKQRAALRDKSGKIIFRNVLARFSSDRLWYLATAIKLNESKYYWVTYKGWGNSELIEEDSIERISQKEEDIFIANNYQGISTPEKQKVFKDIK